MLSKTGMELHRRSVWGTAGWFRIKASAYDDNLASTTLARLDGSIAVSGADMNLSSVSITIGMPTTIDTLTITMPAG